MSADVRCCSTCGLPEVEFLPGRPFCHCPPAPAPGPEQYVCRCGSRFEPALGKYGCPGCAGSNGAARLVATPGRLFTAADALALLVARRDFVPMTDADIDMFGGVESEQPMISYGHGEAAPVVIVDGARIGIIHSADAPDAPDAQEFTLSAPVLS